MITHYDMSTGEIIADEFTDENMPSADLVEHATALRLMRVDEDTSIPAGHERKLPADIAQQPVESFIAKWR